MELTFFTVVFLLFCAAIAYMSVRNREQLLLALWVALAIPAVVAVARLLFGS